MGGCDEEQGRERICELLKEARLPSSVVLSASSR